MEEEKLLSSVIKCSKPEIISVIVLILLIICNLGTKADAFDIDVQDYITDQRANLNKMFKQEEEVNFYIFASFTLSDTHLRQMMDYAKMYNGVIVFSGIENNSFQKTGEHIQGLARDGDEASIIIDPTLFKEFQIDQVPTYVLARREKCPVGMTCGASYDKIIGSITPKYALEKFAKQGDLTREAQDLLEAYSGFK